MSSSGTRSKKVKVWCRIRPTSEFAEDIISIQPDGKAVNIHTSKGERFGVVNNQISDWSFRFDGILHNAAQEEVFEKVASPVVTQAMEGYNGTILCYGQTGAGKTYSMTGATEDYKHRGMIPRALAQLYREIDEQTEKSVNVRISYLEIYNEQMFDLLSQQPFINGPNQQMTIGETETGATYVKRLTQHLAQNEEDALNMLFEGETNRSIAQHSLNKQSSRSHCIFTIYIEARSRMASDAKYTTSKLHFVDLAGSERLGKTNSEGKVKEEALYINKSLSFLEQCVIALADRKRDHVPYRQSKLTHVLRDSIGGTCNTAMVANVWGEQEQIDETVSTFRFSTRMMCVNNEPVVNVHYDPSLMVKKLEREVFDLKRELAMHDTLTNRSMVSYEPLSEQQKYDIKQQVKKFVENQLEEIDIINIKQIEGVFEAFKEVCIQMKGDVEQRLQDKYVMIDRTDPESIREAQKAGVNITDDGVLVGDPDGQGFGVGQAPRPSKADMSPVVSGRRGGRKKRQSPGISKTPPQLTRGLGAERTPSPATKGDKTDGDRDIDTISPVTSASPEKANSTTMPRPSTPPTRNQAFEDFKKDVGSEINRILVENKQTLTDKKRSYGQLARHINSIKLDIDRGMKRLDTLQQERESEGFTYNQEGEAIISEDEFLEIKRLKELKAKYRTHFQELKGLKSEVQYCQIQVDNTRQRLIKEFDRWYADGFLAPDDPIQLSVQAGYGMRAGTVFNPNTLVEDEGEKFERLQGELLMGEPESVSYYNARLRTDRRKTYAKATNQIQPSTQRQPGTPTKIIRRAPPTHMQVAS